jgi:hypothetical protein
LSATWLRVAGSNITFDDVYTSILEVGNDVTPLIAEDVVFLNLLITNVVQIRIRSNYLLRTYSILPLF